MNSLTKVLSVVIPLLLIGLIIPGSIAVYRVRNLGLPISTITAAATVLLPIINGVSLRGTQSLVRRSHRSQVESKPAFLWLAVIVMVLLVIYDTIIATLSVTHMAPRSELVCGLERQWEHLFSTKDATMVRRIQDRHHCCGFNSPLDRAWPFPSRRHTAAACLEAFGRNQSCRDGWLGDEQVTAGLMLLVALFAFLLKIAVALTSQAQRSLSSSGPGFFTSLAGTTEDMRKDHLQQRIEGTAFRDDPLLDGDGDEDTREADSDQSEHHLRPHLGNQAGTPQHPSRLEEGGNNWRDV